MVTYWNVTVPGVNGPEERRAYLYLPACYDAEPQRRFPVLYMFDGHNVFFDSHATYGKCWGMKEYLDATATPLIVAAVECNHGPNNERLSEYTPYPFRNPRFGNVSAYGHETMEWFVRQFKPEIDRQTRTLPDRRHTFIGGSSMGGLMALYAVMEYNHVFSRAAALSPSLWVSPRGLADTLASSRLGPSTVVYMDYGARELSNHSAMRSEFAALCSRLLDRHVLLTARIVPGGQHCEASWERQLPFAVSALMYGL
ncbi:MAG TPA: alpha/beta hydrolase [Candidatus Gemmiger faecigallinarum]|nr:alpha/beta hydrolase [Candidatus Gemmiger faecigallinarum]